MVEAPAPVRRQAVRTPLSTPIPAPRRPVRLPLSTPVADTVVIISSSNDDEVMVISDDEQVPEAQHPAGQVQLPPTYQVVPRFYEPAVPQRRRRVAQHPLPQRYQDVAPQVAAGINEGVAAAAAPSNNYMMKINVKRGIPRRTCFSLEFIPGRQRCAVRHHQHGRAA